MAKLDNIIFGKKKFSDILGEIYDNQKKKETQITGLISELIIKMATIVQRALNSSSGEDALGITEAEKEELMAQLDELNNSFKSKDNKNGS